MHGNLDKQESKDELFSRKPHGSQPRGDPDGLGMQTAPLHPLLELLSALQAPALL